MPRFYGEQKFGVLKENKLTNYESIDLKFHGEMRDYQNAIVSKYFNHVKSSDGKLNGGGLLEIGCGKGKTVMALNIISKLKMKTLVKKHKSFSSKSMGRENRTIFTKCENWKSTRPVF